MDQTNIKQLPEEILLNILEYLDPRSMLNSTLVCKHWNELIGSNTSTMKIMKLYLKPIRQTTKAFTKDEVGQQLLTGKRKFSRVSIDHGYRADMHYMDSLIEVHGKNLEWFELTSCWIPAQKFINFLTPMVNLKVVSLDSAELQKAAGIKAICLNNLQRLKLFRSNYTFFDLVSASEVKTIDLHCMRDAEKMAGFKRFLMAQTKLETLRTYHISQLFDEKLVLSCQLKSLSIGCSEGYCDFTPEQSIHFEQFLKDHTSNLQELEIRCAISSEALKIVFTELKTLRKVLVDIQHLPKELGFYDDLIISKSITEFCLIGNEKNSKLAKKVLRLFVQVEALTFKPTAWGVFNFIGVNFKHLKSLTIKEFPYDFIPNEFRFPQLKHFHTDQIKATESWKAFMRINQSIESVSIHEMYLCSITTALVISMMYHPNLKRIQIEGGLKAMKEFYDIVKKVGWSHVEYMELGVKNLHENFLRPHQFFLNSACKGTISKCHYLDDFIWDRTL